MRRLLEILISGGALIVLCPFFMLIAILVKITSPGPVFFRQVRVGRDRKNFYLLKFRSMVSDAENRGPLLTAGGDERVTRVGKWLRCTKADELPQFWNVLRGDLSLVGPRPEVPKYVKEYKLEWMRVFDVKPGITDLSTLQFRDEESVLKAAVDRKQAYLDIVLPIKIELMLEYLDRRSLRFDLKILILTVWGITFGRFFAKPSSVLADEARMRVVSLNSKISTS